MQGFSKKSLYGFLGVFALVFGLGLGVINVQNQQLFSNKAAEPPIAEEKIAEISNNLERPLGNVISYSSGKFGYRFFYDKNLWNLGETSLVTDDLQKITFRLNDIAGIAEINFAAFENTSGDSLDALATKVAKANNVRSIEKVRIQGMDYYRIEVLTKFINEEGLYYEYVALNAPYYFIITVKYANFADSRSLSEQLLGSFSYFDSQTSVKGLETSVPEIPNLDDTKIVELTKPSVLQIAHLFCNDIKLSSTEGLKYLKSDYKFCDGSLGSGFIINQEGFIGTNGHVVKQYPEASLSQSLLSSNPFSEGFFVDLVREVSVIQLGAEISDIEAKNLLKQAKTDPTYFESFVTLLYKMINEKTLTITPREEKYFVKLANDPMIINQEKVQTDFFNSITSTETVKEATLVSYNYPNPLSVAGVLEGKKETGSDVAIIKIKDPGELVFPSLKLGSSDSLKEGNNIIVIGYPGLVSGTDPKSIINISSSATPTITKGIISAIKTDQGGRKLIQVDASIDHGNSGGPAINTKGEVIGIATYGIGSQSGNFNFLRDIEDLKNLANKDNVAVAPSPTYIKWSEGLGYFWREHYKEAVLPFDLVEASYPIHPSVSSYVSDSESAIDKGQDKSNIVFLLLHDRKSQLIALIFIAIGAGAGLFMVKSKKMGPPVPPPMTFSTPSTFNSQPLSQNQ